MLYFNYTDLISSLLDPTLVINFDPCWCLNNDP